MMITRFSEIIQEAIDNYIVESYSISQEVMDATSQCIEKIEAYYENNSNSVNGSVELKDGSLIPYIIVTIKHPIENCETLNNLNRIVVHIYNFDDVNVMRNNCDAIGIGGETNVEQSIIRIRCSSIKWKIREEQLLPILSHELEHLYQNIKGGIRKDYKNLYDIAATHLDDDNQTIEYFIARLIYYFNQQEIDAKMHELFHDLITLKIENPNEISKCNVIREKNFYLNNFYSKLFVLNRKELDSILEKTYRITSKIFFTYLSKQIHYFEKKTMRVLMEYFRRKDIKYIPKQIIEPR